MAEAVEVNRAGVLEGIAHGFLGRRGGVSTGEVAGLNAGLGAGDDDLNGGVGDDSLLGGMGDDIGAVGHGRSLGTGPKNSSHLKRLKNEDDRSPGRRTRRSIG